MFLSNFEFISSELNNMSSIKLRQNAKGNIEMQEILHVYHLLISSFKIVHVNVKAYPDFNQFICLVNFWIIKFYIHPTVFFCFVFNLLFCVQQKRKKNILLGHNGQIKIKKNVLF